MGTYSLLTKVDSESDNELIINFTEKTIKGTISVLSFDDHGFKICYSPAFEMSGYGLTDEEARDMLMHVVLDDFYETLVLMPKAAAFEELSKLGWVAKGRESERFENRSYVDKDGILRNFDLPEDTVIQEQSLAIY